MIRVLLADDEELVRAGLRLVLESEPDIDVVADVSDGAEVLATVTWLHPDVIVMDVRMPGVNGLQALRELPTGSSSPKVLMLTTFDRDEYLHEAMRLGASGFLLKSSPRQHLLHAVRTVAAGEALLDPTLTRRLVDQYLRRPQASSGVPAALRSLTPRELDVFGEVARGATNREIARRLYLSETTVKTHVASILGKLHLRDRTQVIVMAYETGFVQPGEESDSH